MFKRTCLSRCRGYVRSRLRDGRAVIIVDKLRQHLTLANALEILDWEIPNTTRHFGYDWRQV